MTQEEKAKRYDEVIAMAKECITYVPDDAVNKYMLSMFPELKESEDERIRKALIEFFRLGAKNNETTCDVSDKEILAWLEKQGEHKKFRDQIQIGDKVTRNEDGVLVNISQLKRIAKPVNKPKGNNANEETNAPTEYGKYVDECLNDAAKHFFSEGEDKYSVADLFYVGVRCGQSWVEKQNEQKQLYIRFGDVPNNEKSKIYRGEEEIGEENGVSVYRAFEVNGNIVIGLTLPITQTTLHTQQHLLEYDNRPCYIVKGNYVGEDEDGQPLINNVHIVRKIDRYRVKEEKVDDANKVEPKFKVGDWITDGYFNCNIIHVLDDRYIVDTKYNTLSPILFKDIPSRWWLWTIQDIKDGDIIYTANKNIFIFKKIDDCAVFCYCGLFFEEFSEYEQCVNGLIANKLPSDYAPATREQRNLLFQKMNEAGYEWISDKKKLIKLHNV